MRETPIAALLQTMAILVQGNQGGNRGGAGNPDMAERFDEQKAKYKIGYENDNAVFDRCAGVATGKKVWRQRLDNYIERQTDGIGDDGL